MIMDTRKNTYLSPKNPLYTCERCNYITRNKKDFYKHQSTAKHQRAVNEYTRIQDNPHKYQCTLCGKYYKYHSGLWKHAKSCNQYVSITDDCLTSNLPEMDTNRVESDDNKSELQILSSTILELVKQNNEFKQLLIDQNQKMMDIATNMGNHNTTNSHNNNKFNLNVFLNEKCKDAVSLKDFVKSLDLSIDDFVKTGELGFVDGISSVMIERINSMDLHSRPLHCTDLKRETLYIKDETKWEKDENKEHLRNAVKRIARKNEDIRPIWYHNAPDVDILGSENCEKFLKYSASALGGCGKDQTKSFEDKIMKNILKEVTIDKQMSLL
jgi:sarcosine oxidase delta subunit